MSTILKALRKLEEEKRTAVPRDLPGQVLAERVVTPRRTRSAWLVATGVAGGLLLAVMVGAGVVWLKGTAPEFRQNEKALPTAGVVDTASPVPVQPQEPLPATPVEAKPKGPQVAPSSDSVKDNTPDAPAMVASTASVPPAALSRPAMSTDRNTPEQGSNTVPAGGVPPREQATTGVVLPPPAVTWTAPRLLVTEIFSANAAGGRMALVNGLPVMEGTRVEDALVKEIRAGEVLFEIDGRSVAVPLHPGE